MKTNIKNMILLVALCVAGTQNASANDTSHSPKKSVLQSASELTVAAWLAYCKAPTKASDKDVLGSRQLLKAPCLSFRNKPISEGASLVDVASNNRLFF